MAELLVQVSDLGSLGAVAPADFVHVKQFSDLGDYKITVEDFSASLSTELALGDFSTINQTARSVFAGDGLTGGGDLTLSRTLTLGTPTTITKTSTNSVTATSHTHAIDNSIGIIKGAVVLFPGSFIGKNPVPLGGVSADTNWQICDGTNGTPNLTDRVPVASGGLYTNGATGGSTDAVVVSHTHSATSINAGTHTHVGGLQNAAEVPNYGLAPNPTWFVKYNTGQTQPAGDHNHAISVNAQGVSGVGANMQPYYAIAFIMKIN